jgi:hypothetical protein
MKRTWLKPTANVDLRPVCRDVIRRVDDLHSRWITRIHSWATRLSKLIYSVRVSPSLTALRRHFYVNKRLWKNRCQQWHFSPVEGRLSGNHPMIRLYSGR